MLNRFLPGEVRVEAVRRELKDRDEAITVKIPVTTSSKTK